MANRDLPEKIKNDNSEQNNPQQSNELKNHQSPVEYKKPKKQESEYVAPSSITLGALQKIESSVHELELVF